MTDSLPGDDVLYDALLARDRAYDGFAFVAVKSTGVFCRLTCPARKPRRDNVEFYDTTAACIAAGFRPCKRCRPLAPTSDADPVIERLLGELARASDRRWRESDVVAMGLDPSTVRRKFKQRFGRSFLEIARQRRIGRVADRLAAGDPVIEAQVDAGFDSGSGFRDAIVRLFGEAPARLRTREVLRADWVETPIGPMLAIADARALHLLEFVDRRALPNEIRRLREQTGAAIALGRTAAIDRITDELRGYFAGSAAGFDTPLAPFGSTFQCAVWRALRAIPVGERRSYAEIAVAIERPSAVRAVARANGANRVAIVIPCHRVLGADGSLTGYGGGLWRKRWLLEHERRIASRPAASPRPTTRPRATT